MVAEGESNHASRAYEARMVTRPLLCKGPTGNRTRTVEIRSLLVNPSVKPNVPTGNRTRTPMLRRHGVNPSARTKYQPRESNSPQRVMTPFANHRLTGEAGDEGFEPSTRGFGSRCSGQTELIPRELRNGVTDGTRTRFSQDHNLTPRPLWHPSQRPMRDSNSRHAASKAAALIH